MSLPALAGAIIIQNKRILLIHNIKHGRCIEVPGGKVHAGETHEEAIVRECQEEIGVIVSVGKKIGVYRVDSPEGTFNSHLYLCDIVSGEPTICEPYKCDKIGWYTYAELEELKNEGLFAPNVVGVMGELKGRMYNSDIDFELVGKIRRSLEDVKHGRIKENFP